MEKSLVTEAPQLTSQEGLVIENVVFFELKNIGNAENANCQWVPSRDYMGV